MRVSVVVPARNAADGVRRLLDALDAQTLPAEDYEIVIADDASDDATAAVVDRHPRARLVRSDRCEGSYAARNLGLSAARAPVLAFTDADCRPKPRWLSAGLAALDAGADLAGGKVEVPLGSSPTVAEAVDAARSLDQERFVRDGAAITANLFVRRSVFDAIGSFNRRLRSAGDVEFTRRAVAHGLRLAYAPEAVVVHDPRRRARDLVRKNLRVGAGHTDVRRHGGGPESARPVPWARVSAWRPRRGLLGIEHLEAQGYRPGRARRLVLQAGQYAYVQLPEVIGSLVASARRQ